MKSICFIIHTFPQLSETFVVNQIIGAQQKGFQVKVLTQKLLSFDTSSQKVILEKNNILNHTIVVQNNIPKSILKRVCLTLIYFFKYFKYILTYPNVNNVYERLFILPFKLAFYEKFKAIDVFHVHFANSGIEIGNLKSIGFLKGKLITTFHGYDAHYENEIQLKKLQQEYKVLLSASNVVTTNTPFLATQVKTLGNIASKLEIVPMGIDTNYFSQENGLKSLENRTIYLVSVGRLIEFKGHRYAIQAVEKLVKKGYKVKYSIIGSGYLKKELDQLIHDLNLEDVVSLLGSKTQDEIKEIFKTSDIFLMSSIKDSTGREETQGVVSAEAQAMGLPVVAFNSGGVPYTIKEN
ncbi:MAG: glycosyltransferase, partial [Flavobacterium sp.]|nr:glycosyltransferase [Flavobacterium sp.]